MNDPPPPDPLPVQPLPIVVIIGALLAGSVLLAVVAYALGATSPVLAALVILVSMAVWPALEFGRDNAKPRSTPWVVATTAIRFWPATAAVIALTCFSTCQGCRGATEADERRLSIQRARVQAEANRLAAIESARAQARREREEEETAAAERARVDAEERRPAPERAAMAIAALTTAPEVGETLSRAHALLDPISGADRRRPDVQRAARMLRAQEAAIDRRERAEAEASRGLLCNDGTLSEGCLCHGSRQGCCSWHRGVRGCEPLNW